MNFKEQKFTVLKASARKYPEFNYWLEPAIRCIEFHPNILEYMLRVDIYFDKLSSQL